MTSVAIEASPIRAMDPVVHFSQSYAEARERFLAAAASRALGVESHLLAGHTGVAGEVLAMDVALAGNPVAPGLLMLWSATHGIEGYCGSGCQTALLHDDAFMRAIDDAGAAVLFVHALNPHGFSHGRRVNEDNADLNRNFRDFAAKPPVNAAYAEIHALLLPRTWPPPPESEVRLGAWIAAHGERAFQEAVTGGQYEFADGLFYGGARPSWSNRTLRSVLRRHAARRQVLALIDFHTGLGPRGHGEKIYNGRPIDSDIARVRDWWGPDVTSFLDGSSTSAPLVGINGNAVYEECPGVPCAAIALEYGTIPLRDALTALRADHWLHNHDDATAEIRAPIVRQMREAFYVDAGGWKTTVYAQARDAALIALPRLASHHAYAGGGAP
jgi:hypothetical protein